MSILFFFVIIKSQKAGVLQKWQILTGTAKNYRKHQIWTSTKICQSNIAFKHDRYWKDAKLIHRFFFRNQVEANIVTNKTVFVEPPLLTMILAPHGVMENFGNIDFICHSNYSNYPSVCRTTNHNHTCIFDVTPGQYTLLALLNDPRCNELLGTCIYASYNATIVSPSVTHDPSTKKIVIGTIVSVVIIACVIFFVVKNWKNRKRTRNNLNARYSLQATNKTNEYLIVYARESEEFEKIVDKLKQLLINGDCSKVNCILHLVNF